MNCTNCEREISDQAKFCSYCGERLVFPCPFCETLNAPDALFCQECGRTLAVDQRSSDTDLAGTARPRVSGADCPRCGTTNEPASAYCYQCGLPLETERAGSHLSYAGTQQRIGPPYRVPLARVLVMSVLSAGLYFFYWFYMTWKHYRDGTGNEAYPVWHTLTLFVPIYGLFRVHAHMRTYKELMTEEGMATTISPGSSVVAILVALVLPMVVIAGLLFQVQRNMNQFWTSVYGDVSTHGFSVVEVLLVILGMYVWVVYAVFGATVYYMLYPPDLF